MNNMNNNEEKDSAEIALEEFLFGSDNVNNFGNELVDDNNNNNNNDNSIAINDNNNNNNNVNKNNVWYDKDDDNIQVDISNLNRLKKLKRTNNDNKVSGSEYIKRLRYTYTNINEQPKWVKTLNNNNNNNEYNILSSSASLVKNDYDELQQDHLRIIRCKDMNINDPCQSVVSSIEFHHAGMIAMAAGLDKTIRLFSIDGLHNTKLRGVVLSDLPIRCAHFLMNGTEIIATGRRKYFYSYDLMSGNVLKIPYIKGRDEKAWDNFKVSPDGNYIALCGKSGNIVIISAKTKQWICNLKMNGGINSLDFSSNGDLYSHGTDGDIYIWDMNLRRCISRVKDEGCNIGTCIKISPDSKFCAAGSDVGIVNIYETNDLINSNNNNNNHKSCKPIKIFENITTRINDLTFNHDSQLLVMSSRAKQSQIKVAHLNSMTIYQNWPTQRTSLHYIQNHCFSPNSGYLAIGNDRGKIPLYRLPFYES